jgi:hypothetical protein
MHKFENKIEKDLEIQCNKPSLQANSMKTNVQD